MSPDFDRAQFVILSSIDWDAAWQRHQIFASRLAEAGHQVFFVGNTGFRDPGLADLGRLWGKVRGPAASGGVNPRPPGLTLIEPRVLPPTGRLLRAANRGLLIPRLVRELARRGLRPGAVVISYFATATTLDLLGRLEPGLVVYDCASNFRAHPQAPADFARLEAELLARCQLVVCDSDFLFRQKQAEHGNVAQIHQGVSEDFFRAAPPRPDFRRFCYYGSWVPDLDCGFLNALSRAGFEVTVSGFVRGAAPAWDPGIRRLPPVPLARLVDRLEGFDAFLLPHKLTPFHMGVVPAKIYECLAMGRPVLAVPLPSLEPFRGLISIGETPQRWVELARGLPQAETAELRGKRIALARQHTHAAEFQRFRERIRQAWQGRPGGSGPGRG